MAWLKTYRRIYKFRLNYDGMGRLHAVRHAVRATLAIHWSFR